MIDYPQIDVPTQLKIWHSMTPTQRGKEGIENDYQTLKAAHYASAYVELARIIATYSTDYTKLNDDATIKFLNNLENEFTEITQVAPETFSTYNGLDNHIIKLEIFRAKLCSAINTLFADMITSKNMLASVKQWWKSISLADTAGESESEIVNFIKSYSMYVEGVEILFANVERMYRLICEQVPSLQGMSKRRFAVENGDYQL